jgi:hypothetical protein
MMFPKVRPSEKSAALNTDASVIAVITTVRLRAGSSAGGVVEGLTTQAAPYASVPEIVSAKMLAGID